MRHGFLLIDKPEGPTSHDIVYSARKILSERKIGHLGTLDPAASGLMVLAVGSKALKVVELFNSLSKEYRAEIIFGTTSVTYDREGPLEEVERKPGVPEPDELAIRMAIDDRFIGKIEQVPPAASAIKIGGERAYRKLRQGRSVDIPARTVEITACKIESFSYPQLTLNVNCSSGTYIRSLAHDLGQSLRTVAYLSALKRTMFGDWSLQNAVAPEDAKWTDVIPLKEILKDVPRTQLSDEQFDDIAHGRIIEGDADPDTIAWHNGLPVAILEKAAAGGMKARKVL